MKKLKEDLTEQEALGPRFDQALVYALELHRRQARKGTKIPYASHLLAVASLVIEGGGDEDQAIAALLHHGPEDQGGLETLKEIRRLFGGRVADIVADCSDTFETPKPEWQERKARYVEHLRYAPAESRLVASADKLHNVRCTIADVRKAGQEVWKRFNAPREKQIRYYQAVTDAIRQGGGSPLLGELDRAVADLEELAPAS